MDGEEDDFTSVHQSDDGGGTPVQDEHQASDDERTCNQDDASNDEDTPATMELRGEHVGDSNSHRGAECDSDAEDPRADHNHNSESEGYNSQPVESDEEPSPVKRAVSGTDNEDEPPVKDDVGRAEGQGSSSDEEEGTKMAADSDSDHEQDRPLAGSPSRRSNPDSDLDPEMPARPPSGPVYSEEEEQGEQEPVGGADGRRWKAVMQSDSEDDVMMRKTSKGNDEEQQEEEEHRNASGQPVKRKKAILSDSEDEEQLEAPVVKRSRAVSDDENSNSDAELVRPDSSLAAKLKELGSDSGSEDEERAVEKKDEKTLFGSDSDSGEDEEEKMIADIFGESGDEEEEEFTGFNQEDLGVVDKASKAQKREEEEEESDSDEGINRSGQDCSFMSDFDIMLARRKAMNSKRRRHRDGGTFINDADDVVSAMITKMNEAAEEDRELNSHKKPALKKLTLLPQVVMHLKKQDLKESFIDSGVMSAIKEWISPLPDKSLPALRIREELLRILMELPSVSQETLKHSGIGRAVMYLYKHPKESRSNKDLSLKLINEWSRPIFGLSSNYKGMTREERQQRDLDQQMPQKRRLSQPQEAERAAEPDVFSPPISSGGQTPRRDLEKQLTGEEKALRPGDPGFCARARVPMPSNKDYVVRPKWNVEMDSSRSIYRKGISLLEKHKRRFAEQRKLKRPQGAVKISVEGNRMPL
ncbi:protein IWS1 homolog isoform X2 [Takifugu flavidus]|uniref:protein IWS1 homolog isoform X2 n=1 Tax=Takifugu flavidus TaxID=433684 RepID=UPI0025441898|nr:protein IWS1 homolog isoform X2 [Takifugu flavidus]